MHYYLVEVDIRDGETAYRQFHSTARKNSFTVEEQEVYAQDMFSFGDYRLVRLKGFTTITKEEYKVFQKFGI